MTMKVIGALVAGWSNVLVIGVGYGSGLRIEKELTVTNPVSPASASYAQN
jgi:hypothetical protein